MLLIFKFMIVLDCTCNTYMKHYMLEYKVFFQKELMTSD